MSKKLQFTKKDGFKFDSVIVHGENILGSLQRDCDGNYSYCYVELSTRQSHTFTTSNREELLKQPGMTLQYTMLV